MKKIMAWLMAFIMVFALAACSSRPPAPSVPETAAPSVPVSSEEEPSPSPSDEGESMEEETGTGNTGMVENGNMLVVSITVGEDVLYADLYDNELAEEFAALLPQTISMQRVGGGREFYGILDGSLNYDVADSQTTFENGDVAYWYSGNGFCLFYNDQVEDTTVNSGIIVFGKITSDFSVLHELGDRAEMTVELVE